MQLPNLRMQVIRNFVCVVVFSPLFSTIPKTLYKLKLEKLYLISFNVTLYGQYRVASSSEVPKHFFANTFAVSLRLFLHLV